MTNNIPFEEVQAIIEHGDEAQNGSIEIVNQLRDKGLNIAPKKPENPTTGLLGRWVKHEDHGDVLIISDWASDTGIVEIVWKDHLTGEDGSNGIYTHIDSLTFPEQATRPEDVPVGEAWLVDLDGGARTRIVALKADHDAWKISDQLDSVVALWSDEYVELVSPLVPERPGKSDADLAWKYGSLQQDYAHLEEQYHTLDSEHKDLALELQKAQERIKTLEKPRTATTEVEYAALPAGSIVVEEGIAVAIAKKNNGRWSCTDEFKYESRELAGVTRTVLREGWGE